MNKGEWSEAYVLLKLLADGKLFLGDENYEKIPDVVYPILKLIKEEQNRILEFSFLNDLVVIDTNGQSFKKPVADFITNAKLCFNKISAHRKGSLIIPEITTFLNSFYASHSTARSKHKQDITVQIQDPKTFLSPVLGFSIKSQLGRPSTLLNASGATNFVYNLQGRQFSEREIQGINNTRSFSEKLDIIQELGGKLRFETVDNEIFKTNLQTVDTHFDKILSEIVLTYYGNSNPDYKTIPYLISVISKNNPLGYNLSLNPNMYKMMIKKFLVDYALGMRAAEVWQREYQATGGYLIVRQDGEVICYHFYFAKQFEEYLFQNTKLDTPSSSRHGFGNIYKDHDGEMKFKLNLQIRFIK
ncbi:HpaII family restriction endonuclease [Salinimicrobium xinjiangense]|uniref:HpaII family restriction endonuclease n=1 Tax=Salinimicrobium xinjiangense TaxID=438596 RepID=UPI00040DBF97|nr:HpaII family restriction endonuclease [Salinimicrobium xinjiangense]